MLSLRKTLFQKNTGKLFSTVNVKFSVPEVHLLDKIKPPTSTETNKEELLHYFTEMATMRRIEILADQLYK